MLFFCHRLKYGHKVNPTNGDDDEEGTKRWKHMERMLHEYFFFYKLLQLGTKKYHAT